nr:MAG TPA: hypothetical protein [Caudoviricetes sp.]
MSQTFTQTGGFQSFHYIPPFKSTSYFSLHYRLYVM